MKNLVIVLSCAFLISACSLTKDESSSKSSASVDANSVACVNGTLTNVGIFGGAVLNENSPLTKTIVLVVHEFTGYRDGKYVKETSMCTGSIIDSNMILTAGHCVGENNSSSDRVVVAFSVDPVCNYDKGNKDLIRRTSMVYRHTGYNGKSLGNDLAIIRIDGVVPAGYGPMSLMLDPVGFDLNRPVFVAGYGKQVDYAADESGRAIVLKAAKVYPYIMQLIGQGDNQKVGEGATVLNEAEVFFLDQTRGEGVCAGDSGGPSMVMTSTGIKQLGVASFVMRLDGQKTPSTCRQGAGETSLYYFRDWIRQTHGNMRTRDSGGLR